MQYTLSFYNQSRRPKKPERLFYCLMPDREACGRLVRFIDGFFAENDIRGSRLKTERLHMTLHHIGDFKRLSTALLYRAKLAGKAVSEGQVELRLCSIRSFPPAPNKPNRRPLVLLGDGQRLRTLFHTLGHAMRTNRFEAADDFEPHVTLSYSPQFVPVQAIEPIRFVAKDFVLIHSRLGLTQYEVIDRWPLGT
ncbi:MAG: 2'-5' RNA ligase family protein [Inquilinus sp.]|uniref:2'-5' RNA ligase family protein n=1 Tax=Inquilinus sp. TaxID=1932117 RepID=UPI003F32206A